MTKNENHSVWTAIMALVLAMGGASCNSSGRGEAGTAGRSAATAPSASGTGGATSALTSASPLQATGTMDFVTAVPLPLPKTPAYTAAQTTADVANAINILSTAVNVTAGNESGSKGAGTLLTEPLGVPLPRTENSASPLVAAPADSGTAGLAFSTARADLDPAPVNDQYPYRAAGKLFFNIENNSYICSASLIKKGIAVTAAHCVSEFGRRKYYNGWQFVPGYSNGIAPYGAWSVSKAYILPSYYDGTDECAQSGVVCRDDVAVLVLTPKPGTDSQPHYAGEYTGWFAYGWNSEGFTPQGITHVTQLGYPTCLDNGRFMERNDAQGVSSAQFSGNTVAGSLMCGGSSGGPWLINFGKQPQLTGTALGFSPMPNEVIGVTSWGASDTSVKRMGASPFLDTNLPVLVNRACADYPAACN